MASIRNVADIESMKSDFRQLYNPLYAWSDAVSFHLSLPQLRGFWPMSSVDENGNVLDLSGQGRTLTNNSSTPFGIGQLAPYADFDGSSDYLSRADEAGLDITGGISFGGWFRFDVKNDCGLMGKYLATGNQRSYLLRYQTTGTENFIFEFSRTGASDIVAAPSGDFIAAVSEWNHVVVTGLPTADPSYFATAYFNGAAITDSFSGGGNTLHSGTADLELGAYNGAANFFNGQSALCFLCAATLSAGQILALYDVTRPLFRI